MRVLFKKLPHAQSLDMPAYATPDASGLDLRAAVDEPVHLKPGERALIPTGLQMALPRGFEAQVRPRSGLALRHGITMLNTPGTIDADYRGEIKVLAINLGDEPFEIVYGDRIAQLVIAPVTQAEIEGVEELPGTKRGEGGFGSTGKS
ncbi:MAG: dUTP diphosphatase [Balneolales bacterium]